LGAKATLLSANQGAKMQNLGARKQKIRGKYADLDIAPRSANDQNSTSKTCVRLELIYKTNLKESEYLDNLDFELVIG
jgi:hypothetical protein